jgi:phosphodiesterase/alkaline phosphatase D-like protein
LSARRALPGQPASGAVTIVGGLTTGITRGGLVGAVTDSTVRIWARGNHVSELKLQYRPVGTSAWTTAPGTAFNANHDLTAVIALSGLLPNETYEYRLAADCLVDPLSQSRFRTLPPPGAPGTVRFAYGADLLGRPFAGLTNMAAKNPAFLVLDGDQIYADADGTGR